MSLELKQPSRERYHNEYQGRSPRQRLVILIAPRVQLSFLLLLRGCLSSLRTLPQRGSFSGQASKSQAAVIECGVSSGCHETARDVGAIILRGLRSLLCGMVLRDHRLPPAHFPARPAPSVGLRRVRT